MKVVYNACHGGFGLSEEALKKYKTIKGIAEDTYIYTDAFDRADPILIKIVEEFGLKKAGDKYSFLAITDVPAGQKWRIDEYDGYEKVMLINDYDWRIAT